jgi:hypothetical protein
VEKKATRVSKTVVQPPAGSMPEGGATRMNGKPSGVRFASDEEFRKAHRKTSAQHAGLFRRLAE